MPADDSAPAQVAQQSKKSTPGQRGGARPGAGRKPGAVTPAKRAIAEAAKEHAEAALTVLVTIAKDAKSPAAARVSAANAILDRGYGKPVQAVEHAGKLTVKTLADFYGASDEEADEADAEPGPEELLD
jgi:hypothetical protein